MGGCDLWICRTSSRWMGGERRTPMKHIIVKLLALITLACSLATTACAESLAKQVDIGRGRMMYIECHGSGSPTVLLISGTDTASDLWHAADQKGPRVYDDIQKTTRVCAYDRPGAPHLDQTFSRSDPVPQPTSPQNGVNDLVALLKAADVPGPYVLVAHSFSGTIARVFAGEHPDEVKGIVFVDVLTPELRAQMTPEEWKIWKRINARPAKALAAYPDLERQDFDETLDQTAAAAAKAHAGRRAHSQRQVHRCRPEAHPGDLRVWMRSAHQF